VECAVKACIAKKTKRHEFPPGRKHIEDCYQHDLGKLIKAAGLEDALKASCQADASLDANWGIVNKWSVEDRYDDKITESRAKDFLSAVRATKHGVLAWLRLHW
jgi:hypothetical protein